MKLTCLVTFPKGYIGHPYWPEQEEVITIEKESGMNRTRSAERKVKALRDHLARIGLDISEYEAKKRKAERPFYTVADIIGSTNGHKLDEIVIPAHQIYGAFAQACSLATSSIRIASPEQVRTVLQVEDVYTGKNKEDGVFKRYVPVKSGTGQKLSNQRALRSNPCLGPFRAELTVKFSEDALQPQRVRDFIIFVGREIGVGASRKIGWGRFEVS